MRIISPAATGFHDYYDGLQSLGQDRSVVYLRSQSEITDPASRRAYPEPPDAHLGGWQTPGPNYHEWQSRSVRVFAWPFYLTVAGKIYRGYRLLRRHNISAPDRFSFAYSLPSLSSLAVEMGVPDPLRKLSRIERRRNQEFTGADWLSRQGTEEIREALANTGIVSSLSYLDHEADPHRKPLVLNPRLADFEFYRVMPAFTVYQEIAMWIGGVLPQRDTMPATVSDADRFVEHGFDARTSFRRGPSDR